jgi:hypothetical protein
MRSLVKIAVAGAMLASTPAAFSAIALPNSGNGELVLFVRDANDASKVYARGLNITIDNLLTADQIVNDATIPDNTNPDANFADTDTLTYQLPAPITADANLNAFFAAGSGNYVWTIMAGDNQGTQGNEGTRRYVTTTQVDFTTQSSQIPNSVIGNGAYNNLQAMMEALNGTLGAEKSLASGGLWGQAATSYTGAPNWFGGTPFNENQINTSAHFYLLASSGGGTSTLARVYKGFDFVFDSSGTLSMVVEPGGPEVPLPAAVWLLGSAMVGFAGIRRRRQAEAA